MSGRVPEPQAVRPAAGAGPPALDIERYRAYLLFLARGRLSPRLRVRQDLSDVVNQTLLDAQRDRAQFRGSTSGEMAAWLGTILGNNLRRVPRFETQQVRDLRREVSLWQKVEQSSVVLMDVLADGGPSPSQQVDRNEQLLRLADAMARLPQAQREAIELRYFHRLSAKAIAEQLGRTTGAVGGLLHRGLADLRKLLAEPRPVE